MVAMGCETRRCRCDVPFPAGCHVVGRRPRRCHRRPGRGPERHVVVGRYYDPQTGQFLSVDPMVDGTDRPYAYAEDDPVNEVDRNGLLPCTGTRWAGIADAQCWPTSMTFSSEAALQAWALATTLGSTPWPRFAVPGGTRIPDLYVENSGIVELKEGPWSLSSACTPGTTRFEASSDAYLLSNGHGIDQSLPVRTSQWNFYPNGAGQTSPSVSLVEYLSSLSQMNGNRLTVNIFLYNWEPERVPSRLPIILPDPGDLPAWEVDLGELARLFAF